jgi:hypothetical protein
LRVSSALPRSTPRVGPSAAPGAATTLTFPHPVSMSGQRRRSAARSSSAEPRSPHPS